MYRLLFLLLLCAASVYAQAVKKSPVDLLKEGRLLEAQKILEQTDAPERYSLLLDALREPNAIEACFLYREISARFPGTDCDEFAQERLLQAASMGIDISALVLETAPAVEEGEWPVVSTLSYEVERPLIASAHKEEDSALPVETRIEETERIEPDQTVAEAAVERTAPVKTDPTVEAEADPIPVAKVDQPVSSGITLDYSKTVEAKPDTGIKAAALTEEKMLVRPDKQEEPKRVIKQDSPTKPHDVDDASIGNWYVQVGAFGNHDNAHKFAARLRADGYTVKLVPRDNLLQVQVGAYETKVIGRAEGDKIKAKYDCPAVLVTNP